jgi:hypothetical protein
MFKILRWSQILEGNFRRNSAIVWAILWTQILGFFDKESMFSTHENVVLVDSTYTVHTIHICEQNLINLFPFHPPSLVHCSIELLC